MLSGFSFDRKLRKIIVLVIMDAINIFGSFFFGLWMHYDFKYSTIPENELNTYVSTIWIWYLICLAVFVALKLYKNILSFTDQDDVFRIIIAFALLAVIAIGLIWFFKIDMPKSYYVIGWILSFILTVVIRFGKRAVLSLGKIFGIVGAGYSRERIMIIGAGYAGRMILREYHESNKLNDKVVCFIDDNEQKKGFILGGVPIVGGRDKIVEAAEKYNVDKIIFAIPSSTGQNRKEILDICCNTKCKVEIVPGVYQLVDGKYTGIDKLRKVQIQDLLGRDPVKVNLDEIYKYISGKVVMVTGGGGSIGSELCRQIALAIPKTLIIFDIYENNAYDIQQEIKRKYPDLDLEVLIGSVRNTARLDKVLGKFKPDIVFHAAAHKHVPLMEDSPCEAVKNNAIGTYKTAYAAMTNGCKRFVLISTDKAVNPTNIMGASKRLCEMVIQSFDRMIKEGRADRIPALYAHAEDEDGSMKQNTAANVSTEFVAVRFGNVLGSNGSVIPLFKKQIAEGGPVTVTHPDIIRYFMTIPEAVSLVLQAGTYARGGEIFVLDMGSPVKIDTLARNLIKLSGLKPDEDIMIQYTGLRPGEKLFEEKLMAEEGLKKTENELIHIGCPIPFDTEEFLRQLEELLQACYGNSKEIRDIVADMVSTYHPAGQYGSEEKGAAYEEQIREIR